ncbi:hypothetical protein FPSE_11383 [Fusarium pseudograminearum CS3096]|uniref:Uncharacterized protein n=1 Tax=Fusarium pseudograminearum (strain CS3096) TaxID=1028729 RepID=K3VX68_FUSPC|nr:hypothetical protein FPSE_11383 [Fusarium pseudograminearum CS3096]EKJ68375.1 hypothetical protein FPSE_11383 [Fusarium pseudograminearum CS3096]
MVKQTVIARYYVEEKLQEVLEGLFEEQHKPFNIRMRNDNWKFNVPRLVTEEELRSFNPKGSMNAPQCFIDEVTQPVQLVTVTSHASENNVAVLSRQVSTVEQLRSFVSLDSHPTYFISICQRHSFGRLHITEPMLSFLVENFDLGPALWDLTSCFYDKSDNFEASVCMPFTVSRDGTNIERILIPIANNGVSSFIEDLTEAEYEHLSDLAYLESRLLEIPVLISASDDILVGLCSLCQDRRNNVKTRARSMARASQSQFEQFRRNCAAYTRVSYCLQRRAEKITQLLANTLSFCEQFNAKAQNETMLGLNKSAIFITTLTLLYLPPSFVATFFGMNFFSVDEDTNQTAVTPMIWVFVLCSIVLTIGTFEHEPQIYGC